VELAKWEYMLHGFALK